MKRLMLAIGLLVCLAGSLSAQSRLVMIRVEQPPSTYSSNQIYNKLALALTRQNGLEVEPAVASHPLEPAFPHDLLDVNQVSEWGRTQNAQFIMLVIVQSERLERRKTVNFPLLFHKYETVGVLEGELRLIDVSKGKQIEAKPFQIDLVGPRIFQASMDDNKNDPDIHITAPEKVKFFNRLEDKLVEWVIAHVKGPLGRSDREYVTRPQAKN